MVCKVNSKKLNSRNYFNCFGNYYYECFYDAATDENANLTVKCSENVYNLFTANSSLVYSSNSHISLQLVRQNKKGNLKETFLLDNHQ